jgi:general secretion pathway protein E
MNALAAKVLPAPMPVAFDGLPAEGAPWAFAFELWPLAQAQRWQVLLLRGAAGAYSAVATGTLNNVLTERLEALAQAPVATQLVSEADFARLLQEGSKDFRAMDTVAQFQARGADEVVHELSALQLAEQASPVVRLLDSLLYDALQDGASDIHLECTSTGLALRYRIDGVLLGQRPVADPLVAEQLVSRLKVMAALDIGERRLPQDGRFALRLRGRAIDFRLSIMPSVFGEDAVIRVLDRAQISQTQGAMTLEALGFDIDTRATIRRLASLPNGMLLVTGPTGSGKTTTLYAAITEVNTGRDKIITIEDPVEYELPGVVQVPVNEKKGLTFARGLRSILRHDPDRVMVGEIRDSETAQIAIQAALTGHLVFSTLHANNAIDVLGRFAHMAQRLLRLNCTHCAEPVVLTAQQRAHYGLPETSQGAAPERFAQGRGCPACRGTGYHGRHAVAELFLLDDELRDLIASRAPTGQIKAAARSRGMRSLRETAMALVREGRTTLEELDRVTLSL